MSAAKAVLIDDTGKFLLLTRANHPYFGHDPDLPGGTVDNNDSHDDTVVREIFEEVGLHIKIEDLRQIYRGSQYSLNGADISLYAAVLNSRPNITLSWEHSKYEWVSREEFINRSRGAVDSFMHMVASESAKLP
jgi:8-oxo-dGTP pyrophosphatase MutT (NUDIX family)